MPAPTINKVRETYRKHYKALRDSTSAWHATLEELAGRFDPYVSAEALESRKRVGDLIGKVQREVDLEEGDPYETAMHAAIEALKKDRVETAAQDAYRSAIEDIKADLRKRSPDVREGPKEWSPRKRKLTEEEVEEMVGDELASGDFNLSLFIMFDDKGGLEGWTIEHPDYWQGHGGPVAQVFISDRIDYAEIRGAISEAFQSIDWDEVQKELEEPEEELDEE